LTEIRIRNNGYCFASIDICCYNMTKLIFNGKIKITDNFIMCFDFGESFVRTISYCPFCSKGFIHRDDRPNNNNNNKDIPRDVSK